MAIGGPYRKKIKMDGVTRARLYKELIYIADNFNQDDPEDADMWEEYARIKKRLGLDEIQKVGGL